MNPVCVRCQIEMRVHQNGVVAVVMADYGPMEIRRADCWRCPRCGVKALIGFAANPELSHFDPAFQSRLDSYEPDPRETVVRFWQNVAAKDRADAAVAAGGR
jgi:hypothetical protein